MTTMHEIRSLRAGEQCPRLEPCHLCHDTGCLLHTSNAHETVKVSEYGDRTARIGGPPPCVRTVLHTSLYDAIKAWGCWEQEMAKDDSWTVYQPYCLNLPVEGC